MTEQPRLTIYMRTSPRPHGPTIFSGAKLISHCSPILGMTTFDYTRLYPTSTVTTVLFVVL